MLVSGVAVMTDRVMIWWARMDDLLFRSPRNSGACAMARRR
jgi:hypothetical protein